MKEQKRFAFGSTVSVAAKYTRITKYIRGSHAEKFWRRMNIKPRHGLLIGYRRISNGERWWQGEEGHIYEPKEFIQAALVVFSSHENPILVPLDALEEAK